MVAGVPDLVSPESGVKRFAVEIENLVFQW
jgi:hypothetical protein